MRTHTIRARAQFMTNMLHVTNNLLLETLHFSKILTFQAPNGAGYQGKSRRVLTTTKSRSIIIYSTIYTLFCNTIRKTSVLQNGNPVLERRP